MSFEKDGIPKIANGHMAAPCLTIIVDRATFKQSAAEKDMAYTEKQNLKNQLRKAYGDKWKKHLNIPSNSLENSVKMTF